ncbi:olfactory receptor 6C4 [Sphaeramia orbicularis]|uniref:olfactory receptor 6C4 n=1 Tax=Sphaeramia orbicularis TaxID=375764 RepID=UPI00117CAB57|nr:olfactory receptor 6C4-like [Sphaeramia orbicularis]
MDTERRNFTGQCDRFTDEHKRITEQSEFAACLFLSILPCENTVQVLIFVFVFLTIFSFLINGLVLFGVSRSDDLSEEPQTMLLKNLILSDMLQTFSFGPAVIHSLRRRRTMIYGFWCNTQYFVGTLSVFSSLVIITFMALERYLFVCQGIRYLVILTHRRQRLIQRLIWVCTFSIATIHLFALKIGSVNRQVTSGLLCEPDIMEQIFGFPHAAVGFRKILSTLSLFVCLLVYAFSYVNMYIVARNAAIPFNAVNTAARKTVLFYCGMLFLQLLPLLLKVVSDALWEIKGTVAMTVPDASQSGNLTPSVTATVLHLSLLVTLMVPPCVNPMVYGLKSDKIRLALRNSIRRFWDRIVADRNENLELQTRRTG